MGRTKERQLRTGAEQVLSPTSLGPFLGLGLLVKGVGLAGVRPLPVLMPRDFGPGLGTAIRVRQLRDENSDRCQEPSQTPLELQDSGKAEPQDSVSDVAP